MEAMGPFDNAWTWFDVTFYHPVTFTANFDELVKLQADRFVQMQFSERIYRTEAGAVLGEYRKTASDPSLRMEEVGCDLAYGPAFGYGHTTLGYLADVNDMPSSYASGKAFYETWYRPGNAVVLVAGDVKAEAAFAAVEREYGAWKPAPLPPVPPVADPLGGPKRGHVDWDAAVAPRVSVAHLVPPFRPGTADGAVISLLPELLAGKTSPLYRRIRYEKRTATDLNVDARGSQGFDARLLEAVARVDDERYGKEGKPLLDQVEADLIAGFEELKGFSRRPDAARSLAALKSKYRFDLLAGLDSPLKITSTLSWYYRFGRDPGVLDALVKGVEALKPEDIDGFARRRFTPEERVVVTMTPRAGEAAKEETK
jgi:zinc protease